MDLFNFCFFLSLFTHGLCRVDFPIGNQITIAIPSGYESGFKGRAFVMNTGDMSPNFRAALSVEAVDEKYLCSLAVFFGDLKAWASDHFMKFIPVGRCVLELTEDGDLQLKDRTRRIGWRSGTSGQGVKRLQLLKTGNLILTDAENNTKWQSFDSPTDIMLWGQRLNASARLTYFPSNSSAFYSFEVQHDKLAIFLNWGRHKYSYWDYKPHKNRKITFAKLGSKGLKIFDGDSQKVAQITATGPEPVRFLALGRTGNLILYHYSANQNKFETSYRAIDDLCSLPLLCGSYGICTFSNTCSCMQLSRKLYGMAPECDEGFSEGFCGRQKLAKMVEFEGAETVLRTVPSRINISRDECVSLCMEDCSCTAALYSDGESIGRQKECSLYEFVGGAKQVEKGTGISYWVKVPQETDVHHRKFSSLKKRILIFGGLADGLAICLIIGGLLYYFLIFRKRRDNLGTESN